MSRPTPPTPSTSRSTESAPPRLVAREDPALSARIVACEPLLYTDDVPAALDRPPHVRAASALRRVADGWVIVQDDVGFVAVRRDDGEVTALALPPGPNGRRQFSDALGNKADKLDLEACASLPDGRLVAFGSGSSRRREQLVVVRGDAREARLFDASALYEALRANRGFSGSELNVEGAATLGGTLRLFQRGNGAPVGDLLPVNATVDLDVAAFVAWIDGHGPLPERRAIRRYDLGAIGGVPFGFTDAAPLGARTLVLLGAEDSPDATRDGDVLGARLGVLDDGALDDEPSVRWTTLLAEDGTPTDRKVEGIALDPGGLPTAWAVTDMDDPDVPSLLCELRLDGPWTP